MVNRKLQVDAADFEEQGSFCDAKSGHHYNNVDAFTARTQIDAAVNRGDEVWVNDAPSDPSDNYGVDQRFNLHHQEEDNQGSNHPAKHGPGR